MFHIFGALGQFERDLIRERTRAGLDAAAARGRKGGRPRALSPDKLIRRVYGDFRLSTQGLTPES